MPSDTLPQTPEVTIVVPTFRRPDLLRRTVLSCLGQRVAGGSGYEILVVDNDPEGSARTVVEALDTGHVPLRYVHEPRPGISHARNAGFAHARGRLLALIDDDERASPDWLRHLTGTMQAHAADVVFGPVYPEFERPPARDRAFLDRFYTYALPAPTGTPVGERSTNNALIDRRCVRREAPFAIELGLTGGEDTLFFGELRAEGARMVWCAEAAVRESVPPDRTGWRFVWRRAFQRGQCRASTPMLLHPPRPAQAALWMGVGAVQFLGLLPMAGALWFLNRQTALYCAWKMMGGLGKVFWMRPFRPRTYGTSA
jgi:glycosyltransferase involved in cell wall biosynthesis